MVLNDKQLAFIELYVTGDNMTKIAKELNVSRQMCYKYLENDNIKAEIDRRLTEIKSSAGKKMEKKIDLYISELEKLALTSDSDKIRSDNLQYLIDRVLGKTSSKTLDIDTKVDEEQGRIENKITDLKIAK